MSFYLKEITFLRDSISYLTEYLQKTKPEAFANLIGKLIKVIQDEGVHSDLINLNTIKVLIKRNLTGRISNGETFKLENADTWEPVTFDKYSKTFVSVKRSNAWDKPSHDTMRHRFSLVQELLDENVVYQSSIESLFSQNNVKVRVLGMLTRGTKNEFMAEDLTGTVQLDLTNAEYSPALYFEGGIFEFEGLHNTGMLNVKRVSLPSLKPNTLSLDSVSWSKNSNDRIVFLSDVYLDDPKVLSALYKILTGFASFPPNVFVFCGSFLKTKLAYGYTEASKNAFRHFANILSEFSAQYEETKFVLVPALDDLLPINVLPCASLPPTVTECFNKMNNVFFATNPCRIYFKDCTILICRDDSIEKLCRASIYVPPNAKDIPQHFCDTIWSQRHISPLPLHLNPILPQMDYLLYLWPAPDVLVIADKYKSFDKPKSKFSSLTINPGTFSISDFGFYVFYPASKKVELSSLLLE